MLFWYYFKTNQFGEKIAVDTYVKVDIEERDELFDFEEEIKHICWRARL